jgi:class 3 adenylate cyclase/tetratricopeptide (TPR) repeat protein
MKCPKCGIENPGNKRFCRECGAKLIEICFQCGSERLPGDKFCGECGKKFGERVTIERPGPAIDGERKQATVLLSDLSGYSAISERLDPEEVKEIMSRIFGEIAQVVTKYEGLIEKFIGDAVLALFGVPKAHEDDPVRAIRAAREIHDLVEAMSPELEGRVGQPLSMHTGINTGLVVTGEVNLEKGTHGVAGDTINMASRLSSLARAGEILVGSGTYRQAEGHFHFEQLGPTKIKGKAEPIQVYRVQSMKERPVTIHGLHGLRADLIGRKVEIAQLREAVEKLREGKGTIFSICGDAGTGKSRLVEEFKTGLNLEEIQWREGHAYAYSQNVPYFPLIDLLNRVLHIEEGDSLEKVREKIESNIERLIGEKGDVASYIGSLYSLSCPEVEEVSPELWKFRLQEAIQKILSALAQRAPMVICLEDLHWADPSFLDLLRFILSEFRYPTLFLCVYRLPFSLFSGHELSGMGKLYQEIRLQDLSPSEAQDMIESLLKTKIIPLELRRFIEDKVEGNPFYLEEVLNSLIESETLARDNGGWRLTRAISESDIPSTIHGIIAARLDRLEKEMKRLLQEASVIGRAFLYEILKKITELKDHIDRCVSGLERGDLIRTRSLQPDLEYVFKHALTQEVAYNGLLKKERQAIHERIALVMEELFQDRLSEFYETLAFHFTLGQSLDKAVDYLIKSGEKSWKRYAVEESHQYFKQAFDLMADKPGMKKEEECLFIDLLIKWAAVYNHRGDYRGLADRLCTHVQLAESLDDKERLGMFYGWFGWALWSRGESKDGYQYLCKALNLGEEIENRKVIGYACAWLAWTCGDLGLVEKGIGFGKRAQEISSLFESDQILFRFSMGGMGLAYYFRGDSKKVDGVGKILLDYGQRQSDIRSTVFGHLLVGMGNFIGGDFRSAIECLQRAIQVSVDPIYSNSARFMLGMSYVSTGQLQEAENTLEEVIRYSKDFGAEFLGTLSQGVLSIVSIAKGNLSQGVRIVEDTLSVFLENENKYRYVTTECFLGRVYSQIVQGAGPRRLSIIAKNVGFLIRNGPFASKKAEDHFNRAIEVAEEIGAKGLLGQGYLNLGLLHKAKGKTEQAKQNIAEAIQLFERCEAEIYLKQAKEVLASLE